MSKQSEFLVNNFSVLQRKTLLDVRIWEWITASKHLIPSLSVNDCAKSFLTFYKIDEGELSVYKISQTFFRIQKELFDEQKGK
jgi:hypothetical protein